MDRGSNKHSARVDDELANEGRDAGDGRIDDSRADEGVGNGVGDGDGDGEDNDFSRFGRYIGRSALPGDRAKLRDSAETLLAPDDVLADIDSLPAGQEYHTVAEIWSALGRR